MTPEEKEKARQESWRLYRPVLAKKHADFKRQCEEEGRGYIPPAPLSVEAPDWYKTDTGEPDQTPGEWRQEDPTEIRGPQGVDWLGRIVTQPQGEVPFGGTAPQKRTVSDRLRDAVKGQR